MELSPDHVVIPREDFLAMQEAAMIPSNLTAKDRLGNVAQTTAILAGTSIAFSAAVWGWVKAKDWLEERNFQRRVRAGEIHVKIAEEKRKKS